MHFNEAVEYLLSLGHETLTIKLGLRNTERLLSALNNPERSFTSVQIAGTNGKGSTAVTLDSICRAAGIRAGLYTSPHLVSITERISIAGIPITPEDFAACATRVRDVAQQLLHDKQIEALPTFFEHVTATALLAFRDAGIELAILETGLGGRLDSTTAAKADVVGITSIAMDHEQYLGNTLESIAAEKAAIIRPGVSAAIANQPPEVMQVLLRRCEETGVVPVLEDGKHKIEEFTDDGRFCVTLQTAHRYERVLLGLRGRHQIENAAMAIRLGELLQPRGFGIPVSAFANGISNAEHAGRLEIVSHEPLFLLDGAHNPAGAKALRAYLDEFARRPLTLVFGAMRDKRLDQIAQLLFPLADVLILTTVNNPRSASTEMLARYANGAVTRANSTAEAIELAVERTPSHGLICVAGSLYLIGEVRPLVLSKFQRKQHDNATQRTAKNNR